MTISHSPAPARSDVATTAPTGANRRPYAVHGGVLTAGALAWAATMAVVGIDPVGHTEEVAFSISSGLFQVDGLLKAKLRGSGLEPYVEVIAHIDTEAEKRLVPVYRLET